MEDLLRFIVIFLQRQFFNTMATKYTNLNKSPLNVKVETKGAFKHLNNTWLEDQEIVGTRVTCIIGETLVDFNINEVEKFSAITFVKI